MPPLPSDVRARITAVILAGGLGRRMGGQDKGLTPLGGRPMAAWVLDRLQPQVGRVIVNANRNQDAYGRLLGLPVVGDRLGGFQGPLAGIAGALAQIDTPLLLATPCDGPLLPPDLAERLYRALSTARADVAVVHDGERLHPVFALLRTGVRGSLEAFLAAGERKAGHWLERTHWVAADCADIADAFVNVNDAGALAALETRLRPPAAQRSTTP